MMFRCEGSDRIYPPQLPPMEALAYKADSHNKILKKEDAGIGAAHPGRQTVPAFVCL